MPFRNRSAKPALELLEERCTPTVWNNPWPDPSHLTLSFAPDGTQVGTQTSNLFRLLNHLQSTSAWQFEAMRAWQTWAVQSNINIGIVSDNGDAFGTTGMAQGDGRFGDIRLAATRMTSEVGAIASPFEAALGTWAGDMKLNNHYSFGRNGRGDFDLFTTFLHEAGHTLGLDHNTDPASVLYESYSGPRTGLAAIDIANLRKLYGAREHDQFDAAASNGNIASATRLSLQNLGQGVFSTQVEADITVTGDKDYFKFQVPLGMTGLTVRVQTKGLSLLTPRLNVYDGESKLIATVTSPGPNGGNLEVRVNSLSPFATYYVRVDGARTDVFGIGGYVLKVDSLPGVTGVVDTAGGVADDVIALINNDLHTDDTFATASLVPPVITRTNSRFDFAYRASISDAVDVDFYKITAPTPPAGTANVMTVMAWGLSDKRLNPQVTVYDATQREVAAEVLVTEQGKVTVQVTNATPGATYLVKVAAADPNGVLNFGNYFLGVDFGPHAVTQRTFANGTLTDPLPQTTHTVTTTRTQVHHFVLSTTTADRRIESAVRMTIFDANNNVVLTRVVQAGQVNSFDITLSPGTYTVRLAAGTRDKSKPLPDLGYTLRGFVASDPIGPQPSDPSGDPAGGGGGPTEPQPTWNGGVRQRSSSDPYGDPYSPA